MGMIINIDKALELRTDYNVLGEALNKMLQDTQEAWERENPIDLLFARSTMDTFQETFTSSIGFDHAFTETGDYQIGPIFNTAEGFSATYTTRTFQGSFIITQQALEDRQLGKIKDDANAFMRRWHGDIVEYCMTALDAGFGVVKTYETTAGKSRLQLFSADTVDGDIHTPNKNNLFSNKHKAVKRDDMSADDVVTQANFFRAGLKHADDNTNTKPAIVIGSNDPGQIAKLADFINQVITEMENYKDDNGKRAGVIGSKTIVAPNDAHLKAAIEAALSMETFGGQPNVAYKRATAKYTPYLNDTDCCKDGLGFFIVDKEYQSANHGLELTERIPLTLDVTDQKRPKGIIYDGRQRFDVNVCSWRGIAFCYIGTAATDASAWNYKDNIKSIVPVETLVKPVSVVGTVSTKAEG